ncbi:hypothetical protein QQF64_034606 [Cirrhinus molitorella]|uniref:ribonuclease H n=1 Tax=Cirrhinus molitorella TaxID=172907 RepID=A0ABR3L0X8_9TELE
MVTTYTLEEDGLQNREVQVSSTRLQNSAIICNLKNYLAHLGECQDKELSELLDEFPSLFSDVPGKTTICSHDIDVGDASPIKQHPYRANPKKHDIMKSEVEYMLKYGIAVPSQSPWSSPCLLVPKPDSTYRFCTDCHKVNCITKADFFPLPRMEDFVDRVGNTKYVTKLDLLKGYWQVPLTQRASEISAFVTPDSLLQYSVLAFGMRNAPATFQRLMNTVLADVENCVVYLDDCEFGKGKITYLGKQVGQGMVKPVEAKITAVLEYPVPSDKPELRSTPILKAPEFDVPFKLQIDVSATGAGAVLLQEDQFGVEHPISYFSKKFSKRDAAYPLLPWLMKPFREGRGVTAEQINFNHHLSQARMTVERAFGRLKVHNEMFSEGDYEEDEGEVNEMDDRENREQAGVQMAQDIRNANVHIFQG